MPRSNKGLALLCVGLVLFAAFFPAATAALAEFVLVPLWIVLPAVAVTTVRRNAFRCDEQPIALLAVLDPRGPPKTALL